MQGYVYHQTLFALTYMHRLLQFDSVPQAVYHIKARETHFKMFSLTFVYLCLAYSWHPLPYYTLCFKADNKPKNKAKTGRDSIRGFGNRVQTVKSTCEISKNMLSIRFKLNNVKNSNIIGVSL